MIDNGTVSPAERPAKVLEAITRHREEVERDGFTKTIGVLPASHARAIASALLASAKEAQGSE